MFIRPRIPPGPGQHQASHFMRGRIMGLVVSAMLSTASVVLFFYPGLNLGIDFSGGIVMEVRTPGPADFAQIRAALAAEHIPEQGVQQFGDPSEVLIRLGAQPTEAAVQQAVDPRARRAGEGGAGDQGAAHRCGGRVGVGRTVPQRPAGARHQSGDDPGLHLVPLRMAVRGRRRGDADPGHHQGHRLPGHHAHRVRPGDGRGDPDRSSATPPTTRWWSTTGCARISANTRPCRCAI